MLRELLPIVLTALVLFSIVVIPSYFLKSIACSQKATSFEDHKFGVLSGCMVKHNGKWLPLDNIRGFDDKG